MADLSKTVEIVFGGKNELSGAISKIGSDFNNLTGSITSVTGPLDEITNKVLGAQAAFASMAVGGMAIAIKAAGDFNGKFGEITTLISDTGAPIEAFKANIKSYAVDSVKGIDEINQAIYTAVSAGVDYTKSIDFVTQAEKLSVAGRSNLGDTTKVLISVLNAYGQSTDQAGKYSDIMFATVKGGLTTMTELSASLSQVTGLAANSGIPFETLSTAIATLTSTGMPTTQAITSIKAAIQNIIKPTAEAEEMSKKLGLQFNASALQTKGFEVILQEAWKATKGNTDQMAQLFGSVESLNGVLVLASDKTGKFKSSLEDMAKSAGGVDIAYKKVADEFENVNTRLLNSLKITLGEIGEKLMPNYGKIAGSLGDLLKRVKVGVDSGAFDPLFDYLDKVGIAITAWIAAVGKAFPEAIKDIDYSGLLKSLDGLGGSLKQAFKSIFGDIDLTTPTGLHLAIQRIVDSFAALTNVTKGVVDGMNPLFRLIGEGIDKFSKLDQSSAGLIGNLLGVAKGINIVADYAAVMTSVLTILSGKALLDTIVGVYSLGTSCLAAAGGVAGLTVAMSANPVVAAFLAASLVTVAARYAYQKLATDDSTLSLDSHTEAGKKNSAQLYKDWEAVNKLEKAFLGFDTTTGELTQSSNELSAAQNIYNENMLKLDISEAQRAFDELNASLKKSRDDLEAMEKMKKLSITVEVLADGTSIETTKDMITKTFPDGTIYMTNIGTRADEARLAATKAKIEEVIPKEKLLEIQATLDVAKIKAAADTIATAIQWQAKLDIADVEANAKKVEAAFKSIDNTVTSTGTTLSSLVGVWSEVMKGGKGGTSFIEQQIRDENERRDAVLKKQNDLLDAEIDNMKARTKSLQSGNAMITIDGAGLQPHLESFMFEILSQIQIKANAEGQKFLVGI